MKIAPSLLAADYGNLESQIIELEKNNIEMLHIDMMDGNFVPNITFGPDQIKMLRKKSNLLFDVHMMVEKPDRFIPAVAAAGADIITIHQEATPHLHRSIQLIKEFGKKAGVVLNPATSVQTIKYILDDIDMVLLMTVNPGYGGQKFIPSMVEKIKEAKELIKGYPIEIEVDGGINEATAAQCLAAGADILVSGTSIFQGDIKNNINQFKKLESIY